MGVAVFVLGAYRFRPNTKVKYIKVSLCAISVKHFKHLMSGCKKLNTNIINCLLILVLNGRCV